MTRYEYKRDDQNILYRQPINGGDGGYLNEDGNWHDILGPWSNWSNPDIFFPDILDEHGNALVPTKSMSPNYRDWSLPEQVKWLEVALDMAIKSLAEATNAPTHDNGPVGDFGEPWQRSNIAKHKFVFVESTVPAFQDKRDRQGICEILSLEGAEADKDRFAERIVACVNALQGLDPRAVKDMVKALERALEDLEDVKEYGHFFTDSIESITKARAKARGKK